MEPSFYKQSFFKFSLIYSKYNFQLTDKYKNDSIGKNFYAEYNSGIIDYSAKYDIDFIPNPKHWVKGGFNFINHQFNPYAFVEEDNGNNTRKHEYERIQGLETGLYLEDTYQPLNRIKINAGLRYSIFFASHEQYQFFEPRISVAVRLKKDLVMKSSFASMNQYVHLLTNTGISLPTDLWVPCNDKVSPQHSKQFALGIVKDYYKEISVSLEGYYKKLNNIIGYKEGANYLNLSEAKSASESKWIKNITSGQAWSYGMELLIQKKTGKFNGWMGYTLSWTQQQFDSLNYGRKFYARYDRRNDISIVGIYNITERITISASWIYGTGNALSLAVDQYVPYSISIASEKVSNTTIGQFGNLRPNKDRIDLLQTKNNFRTEAYHRLDVGIQFHRQKKWGKRTWEISFYNLYNRKNPFFYYSYNDHGHGKLKRVSLFPIIPSFSYTFKF